MIDRIPKYAIPISFDTNVIRLILFRYLSTVVGGAIFNNPRFLIFEFKDDLWDIVKCMKNVDIVFESVKCTKMDILPPKK